MPATDNALVIPARYCGPTSSGNGGYTAGLLAERFANHPAPAPECPVVEVTLRTPPPLDTDLRVEHLLDAPATRLLDGETVVAEARCTDEELQPVDEVPVERAVEAMHDYAGLRSHPFPRCFACGPAREEGDGLRIFPGPVGEGRVASVWVPHASLAVASDLLDPGVQRVGIGTAWAALDCVGGWSTDLEGRPMVLGQIAAQVDALPVVGETHVVVGAELRSEGRKTFTASTVYDSDGRIVARARHTWIAIDPAAFT
jgi:acyl-coenzyme A thioesterase PaaI-like protein